MNAYTKNTLIFSLLISAMMGLSSCADELSEVTTVDKLRVLGVAVNPPEIRPEHTGAVTVEVLWHDPEIATRNTQFAWVFCLGDVPAATGYEYCEPVDATLLPPTIVDAADGGDSFTIPALPPSLFSMIPEGESAVFTAIVLMCAGGTLPDADALLASTEPNIDSLCRNGDAVSMYKNITVANGSTFNDDVNTAPAIQTVTINNSALQPVVTGDEVNEIVCVDNKCDRGLSVDAAFTPESTQSYTVVRFDEPLVKTERPYISWYATGGEFEMPYTMTNDDGTLDIIKWNPDEAGDYTLWAVANDGRGGVSWNTYRLHVGPF
ncbi:MAG: hypothetical protein JXX29_12850 [Deltaproteobacteria bacterium]|nr:hypothetical protein [Deltaproteobacteria bacterium]MBN2672565.1 hypothetical protein [Deltaproteobacteria bacterium]